MSALISQLEEEAIYIIREVYATADNPVVLYSAGKDSSVLLHLVKKALYPENVKFKFLHIDTKWKFKEMISFRDSTFKKLGYKLLIFSNKEGIKNNVNPIDYNSDIYTDIMKTQALRQALQKYNFDFIVAGARRDEEKSRSKEKIFSLRKNNSWSPKEQRPEFWKHYNKFKINEDTFRVFPLSNWKEIDIWEYIKLEKIKITNLYFARKRKVIKRNKLYIPVDDQRLKPLKNEKVVKLDIRFRTLGCYPLTAGVVSKAKTIKDIIKEINISETSERNGRLIDHDAASSMELKKIKGYF